MYLFFKGGLQVNRFVTHHELLGDLSLGSGLVARWCKLYFADHQTTGVPNSRKKDTQRGLAVYICCSWRMQCTIGLMV